MSPPEAGGGDQGGDSALKGAFRLDCRPATWSTVSIWSPQSGDRRHHRRHPCRSSAAGRPGRPTGKGDHRHRRRRVGADDPVLRAAATGYQVLVHTARPEQWRPATAAGLQLVGPGGLRERLPPRRAAVFVWDGTHLWLHSIVKRQRWTDLTGNPDIAVVIDAGTDYPELRGVEIHGQAVVVGEVPTHPTRRCTSRNCYSHANIWAATSSSPTVGTPGSRSPRTKSPAGTSPISQAHNRTLPEHSAEKVESATVRWEIVETLMNRLSTPEGDGHD